MLGARLIEGGRYDVMVFTNQGGLKEPGKNTTRHAQFKSKVSAVLEALGLPITVYAATCNDLYRKPRAGMWEAMKADLGGEVEVKLVESFLVGDAAGREGDFSDSDR